MQTAPKKLRVSAILLGIVGGIVGLAAGLFLGFALGAILARVMHVSSFEGGAGYFAISIALLVTVLVAPIVILLTLYWRGTRGIWLFIGLLIVCVSMFAIAASGLGIWYAAQPHVLNLNGPTPLLEFEVKPPQGESVENLDNVEPELDTDQNAMPGTWRTEPPETAGYGLATWNVFWYFAAIVCSQISGTRRPHFQSSSASESDELEISELV